MAVVGCYVVVWVAAASGAATLEFSRSKCLVWFKGVSIMREIIVSCFVKSIKTTRVYEGHSEHAMMMTTVSAPVFYTGW